MPLSSATITFDLSDHFGTDYDVRRGIRAWVDTNIDHDTVIDTDGNKIRVGSGKVTVNADGTGTATVWVPGTGSNPASWQTYFHFEYVDSGNHKKGRQTRTFGPFTITGNADLADLVPQQEVPPTYLTAVTAQLDEKVAAAEADRVAVASDRAFVEARVVDDLGTTDGQTKALIETPASQTAQALSATIVTGAREVAAFNGWQDTIARIRTQQQDVNLLFVGDSTMDMANGTQSWLNGFAAALAARFPTHTVEQRTLDTSTANAWNAATTIATGTGYRSDLGAPKKIVVWIAGWANRNWRDFYADARRATIFTQPNPDLILFALGHNDGAGLPDQSVRGRALVLIEWARSMVPGAHVILSSQNPRTASPGRAEVRNDIYRQLARERGYGYVNVTQAFYDDGRSIATGGPLTDALGVHPTTAGAVLWRDTVLKQIDAAPKAPVLPSSPPSITLLGRSLVGIQQRPLASNGWTLTNTTEAVESTIVRRGATSLKLTKTAGGATSYATKNLPLAEVKGRTVTAYGWMYIPTGANTNSGQVWLIHSGSTLVSYTITETAVRDEWFPIAVSGLIPNSATSAQVRVFTDAAADAGTPSIILDSLDVFVGDVPLDSRTDVDGATPSAWTAPTLSGTWVDFGAGYATAQYRKVGDRVEIRGLVKSGAATSAIFTLPTGFRPPNQILISTASDSGHGRFWISSGGVLTHIAGGTGHFSLECSFSTST